MPHIVIEASKNVAEAVDTANLVIDAHEALAGKGVDKSRIKTRLMVAHEVCVGTESINGTMVHVTLLLLEGRDVDTKNNYSTAILNAIKPHLEKLPNCAITCEVRDMEKDTYVL